MAGISTTTAVTPKNILFCTDPQVAVSVVLGNAGLVADAAGKKILKAGTPVYGDLSARTTAFVLETTGGGPPATSNAVGIVLHDVDVTAGDENGQILIFGFVNLDKLDAATAALITAEVIAALKGKIHFLK